jgi:signal transduction histidine kinase
MNRTDTEFKFLPQYAEDAKLLTADRLFISQKPVPVRQAQPTDESLTQAILDAVPASVYVVSQAFTLVRFNKTFAEEMERQLGVTVTPGYDFLSLTGIGNSDRWKDLFVRVFAGNPVLERWEAVVPGHSNVLEISAQPVFEDGSVVQAAFYIKNLSEDVRSSTDYNTSMERAKLALESTESLAFDWDLTTQRIEITNLEGITGYAATPETCTAAWWFDRVIEADKHKLNLALAESLLAGDTFSVDYRISDISGNVKDVHTKAAIFRDFDLEPIRLVGITQDITPRKILERDLIEARVAAEEMNRLKSAFLANMSHEIRTPLTAVIGYADVLSEQLHGTELGDHADVICRSGNRLLATINSLLDLAKIEANMIELKPEILSINSMTTCIVKELRPIADQKALTLVMDDVPFEFFSYVDRHSVARIFYNLIGNALKFTEKGGVMVRLSKGEIGTESAVVIEIIDTGVGVSDASRIFEPFVQESDGVARKYEGTGLGLSITRKLVELLEGSISVRSTPGAGSTFSVRLPLLKVFSSSKNLSCT